MARKPVDIKRFLVPKLRNFSRWWPNKNIARDQAKVKLEVGKTKSGKPKFRVFYRCNICKGLFGKEETSMDHIHPVIKLDGFKDWNEYIDRLFCAPEGFQCLCNTCHDKKTKTENKIRKKLKK